jgi:hypothetical protein
MTPARRSLEFAWLTLVGVPGFVWCTLTHFCLCGHLAHDDPPGWRLYVDGIWAAAFVAAAVSAVQSDMMSAPIDVCLLLFLVFSRLLLANVVGIVLLLMEIPAVAFLVVHAAVTIFRVRWQRKCGST